MNSLKQILGDALHKLIKGRYQIKKRAEKEEQPNKT